MAVLGRFGAGLNPVAIFESAAMCMIIGHMGANRPNQGSTKARSVLE